VPQPLARLAVIQLILSLDPRRAVIALEASISIQAPVLASIARLASTLVLGPLQFAPIAPAQANIREKALPFVWLQERGRSPTAGELGRTIAMLKHSASVPPTLAEHAKMALTLLKEPRPVAHALEGSTTTQLPQLALTASLQNTLPLEFSLHALNAMELASTVVPERHFA